MFASIYNKIRNLLNREEGQGMVEYALILVLIAVVVIVVLIIRSDHPRQPGQERLLQHLGRSGPVGLNRKRERVPTRGPFSFYAAVSSGTSAVRDRRVPRKTVTAITNPSSAMPAAVRKPVPYPAARAWFTTACVGWTPAS